MDNLEGNYLSYVVWGTPAYDLCVDLRHRVLRMPLDMSFQEADILSEWDEDHWGYYHADGPLLSCLSYRYLAEDEIKMRQVATEPHWRGQGYGSAAVRATERWYADRAIRRIRLHARKTAVSFYKRLGYYIDGDLFQEVGIDHYVMIKDM